MSDNKNISGFANHFPFPCCTVNSEGKVTGVNSKISEVFLYDDIAETDIFILTNYRYKELLTLDERETPPIISRNDKFFRIMAAPVSDEPGADLAVYFIEVTLQETLKKRYNDEKPCIVIVEIDNYEELIAANGEERRASLSAEINQTLRQAFMRLNASITKVGRSTYVMIIDQAACDRMIENKFPVLDEIRKIESEADFPVTISIGVGIGGKNLAQTDEYAGIALDLARGRGGDQAAVKNINKVEYYGGRAQSVERINKGKSRIVAHALHRLLDEANKVIVMGHANPDMDSFGAAIGISRFAMICGKDVYIVLNYYNETLTEIYNNAKEAECYNFIGTEKALSMIDDETLLIVVDTHRPGYVEAPELLEKTDKLAIIDHHRKAEDVIQTAKLSYIESYASSASELVSEMLQYVGEKKNVITKFEAEALLAGITVDTNSFAVKTGVRTFEAAAWLRRAGADTATVKRFFQMNSQAFMLRAKCVANAKFLAGGHIAISILEGQHVDAQILDSQAADELLDVRGVKASFVVGTTMAGRTVISARSLGEINVQVIMEQLGGGGHLTTAGAQSNLPPEETVKKIEKVLLDRGHIKSSDIGVEETMEEQAAADEEFAEAGVVARGGSAEQLPGLASAQIKELKEVHDESLEELMKDNRDDLIGKAVATVQAEKAEIERGRKK